VTYRRPKAKISNQRLVYLFTLLLVALCAWGIHHLYSTIAALQGRPTGNLEYVFAFSFLILAFTLLLSAFDKPKKVNRVQQAYLNKLNLAVIVPCYNEDPILLKRCVESLVSQSRKPNEIIIVDDGSTVSSYSDVKKYSRTIAKRSGVKITWKRTNNHGKRHAQSIGINLTPQADIYLTVDSDGILDREAIKEGLKPFIDRRVKSVAGVVMAINNRTNLLTRFTDLWFVTGQLIDRSSFSTVGSVLVNSGVLAFYDAAMLRKYLDSYCNENFFGVHVELSDDSMLTMYAIAEGRAVQQTTSFAFTAMPETISHHLRQYVRWMRGAFIRTWWRFKYLPMDGYAYWSHLLGWVQMLIATIVFISFFVVNPVFQKQVAPYFIIIPILVGYGQALRYLTIKRSDESIWSQLLTFSLAVVLAFWTFFVLRVVRWYAMITCRRTGWATRETLEVKAT
jgi:hyaluronan synthase